MKRAMSFVLGVVLLCLVLGPGNLFADELKENYIGFRYNYLMPDETDQFPSGDGFELFGMFKVKSEPGSPKVTYLEVFLGSLTFESDADYLSEGELSSSVIGASILWGKQTKTSHTYFGLGIDFYTDDFEMSSTAENDIWDFFDWLYWTYFGETLLSLDYEEYVDDTFGLHVKGGGNHQLSEQLYFNWNVKWSYATADCGAKYSAKTTDGVFDYYDSDSDKDEIDLGGFSINFGLALKF